MTDNFYLHYDCLHQDMNKIEVRYTNPGDQIWNDLPLRYFG